MRSPTLSALLLLLSSETAFSEDPPSEWIEPATGHRVVRLSNEPGSASLYFHQNAYTAKGDKLLISTPGGLSTVDLETRRIEPVVEGRVSHVVVGPKSRQVFYIIKDGSVYATHLDTKETRAIVKRPELRSGSGLTVNADETLLAGSYVLGGDRPAPPSNTQPQSANPLAQPPPQESRLEARWAQRLPMALYTIDVKTGEVRDFHEGKGDWLNHVQFSPTDRTLVMFCHEGPWHKLDRIWTLRSDGSGLRSVAAPGNGQWIYLYTPRPHGLEVERLVDLAKHDYQLEPNVTFTPDGKWIVFRSNMHGVSHVYAVEVRKAAP